MHLMTKNNQNWETQELTSLPVSLPWFHTMMNPFSRYLCYQCGDDNVFHKV